MLVRAALDDAAAAADEEVCCEEEADDQRDEKYVDHASNVLSECGRG